MMNDKSINNISGFLIYDSSFNDIYNNPGAIRLDTIKTIKWSNCSHNPDIINLIVNDIIVYSCIIKSSEFQLKVLKQVLIHIENTIQSDLYINNLIKDVI